MGVSFKLILVIMNYLANAISVNAMSVIFQERSTAVID